MGFVMTMVNACKWKNIYVWIKKILSLIFFRCQAPVSISNLSRCNLGEDACNVFCTATGHVNGTCEEEEVTYFLNQILNIQVGYIYFIDYLWLNHLIYWRDVSLKT